MVITPKGYGGWRLWGDNSNNPFFRLFIDSKQRFGLCLALRSRVSADSLFLTCRKKTLLEGPKCWAAFTNTTHYRFWTKWWRYLGYWFHAAGKIWWAVKKIYRLRTAAPAVTASATLYMKTGSTISGAYAQSTVSIHPGIFHQYLHSNRKGNTESSGNVTSFWNCVMAVFLKAVWGWWSVPLQ